MLTHPVWRQTTPCAVAGFQHQAFTRERRIAGVLDRMRVRPDPDRPVEVQLLGPDQLDVLYARDISETGIGVFIPPQSASASLSSQVELIVSLPDAPSFQARGILRHRTASGPLEFFGVELTHVPESARANLRAYIHARRVADPESKTEGSRPRAIYS